MTPGDLPPALRDTVELTQIEAERAAHEATRQRLAELRRIVVDYVASCHSSDAAVSRAGLAAFGRDVKAWLEAGEVTSKPASFLQVLLAVAPRCQTHGCTRPAVRGMPAEEQAAAVGELDEDWLETHLAPRRCDKHALPHWPDLPQAEAVRALSREP